MKLPHEETPHEQEPGEDIPKRRLDNQDLLLLLNVNQPHFTKLAKEGLFARWQTKELRTAAAVVRNCMQYVMRKDGLWIYKLMSGHIGLI